MHKYLLITPSFPKEFKEYSPEALPSQGLNLRTELPRNLNTGTTTLETQKQIIRGRDSSTKLANKVFLAFNRCFV